MPLTHRKPFLQADGSEEFAEAVLSLLKKPVKRKELAEAGRKLVEERYSWAQVVKVFESRCQEII